MTAAQARYWYKFVVQLANRLDTMNTADAHASIVYETGNEGLRRIALEMLAHTEEITATDEMPVVKVEKSA